MTQLNVSLSLSRSVQAAVHCHAGLGRTGLFIGCYLLYTYRMSANQAIYFIREKRDGAVQMSEQIQVMRDFERYLMPLRVVYSAAAQRTAERERETNKRRHGRANLRSERGAPHGLRSVTRTRLATDLFWCV